MARTRLDADSTMPARTAPGDGAHDTTDATERASTVRANPGSEAIATGTVNGAVLVPWPTPIPRDESNDRIEVYPVEGPAGLVWVRHNIDTAETRVIAEDEALDLRRRLIQAALDADGAF